VAVQPLAAAQPLAATQGPAAGQGPTLVAAAAPAAGAAAAAGAVASPPWDVIVGSDLIYYTYSEATPHSRLLLGALKACAGPATPIFLSLSLHHNPGEVERFLRWAAEDGFHVERVAPGELPEEYRVQDVLVARLQLRCGGGGGRDGGGGGDGGGKGMASDAARASCGGGGDASGWQRESAG
jgi:uncharacterized membrane protein YgcG